MSATTTRQASTFTVQRYGRGFEARRSGDPVFGMVGVLTNNRAAIHKALDAFMDAETVEGYLEYALPKHISTTTEDASNV